MVGIKKTRGSGISAIEILVAVSIIAVTLTSLLGVINFSLKSPSLLRETTQANLLAQEAIEAARTFRDSTNWTTNGLGTLSVKTEIADNPYYPKIDTSQGSPRWVLLGGEEIIVNFTRKVIFEKVFRDASGNIAESGAEDSGTRKVTAVVSWDYRGANRAVELVTYLTDWK